MIFFCLTARNDVSPAMVSLENRQPPTKGDCATTYVKFTPLTYTLEQYEKLFKKQFEAAGILADEYRSVVREAVGKLGGILLPTGNRDLLEVTVLFHWIPGHRGSYALSSAQAYLSVSSCFLPSMQSSVGVLKKSMKSSAITGKGGV